LITQNPHHPGIRHRAILFFRRLSGCKHEFGVAFWASDPFSEQQLSALESMTRGADNRYFEFCMGFIHQSFP
jgi:hypothetical protein